MREDLRSRYINVGDAVLSGKPLPKVGKSSGGPADQTSGAPPPLRNAAKKVARRGVGYWLWVSIKWLVIGFLALALLGFYLGWRESAPSTHVEQMSDNSIEQTLKSQGDAPPPEASSQAKLASAPVGDVSIETGVAGSSMNSTDAAGVGPQVESATVVKGPASDESPGEGQRVHEERANWREEASDDRTSVIRQFLIDRAGQGGCGDLSEVYCESEIVQKAAKLAYADSIRCDNGELDGAYCDGDANALIQKEVRGLEEPLLLKEKEDLEAYIIDPEKHNYNTRGNVRILAEPCMQQAVDRGMRSQEFNDFVKSVCMPDAMREFLKPQKSLLRRVNAKLSQLQLVAE